MKALFHPDQFRYRGCSVEDFGKDIFRIIGCHCCLPSVAVHLLGNAGLALPLFSSAQTSDGLTPAAASTTSR